MMIEKAPCKIIMTSGIAVPCASVVAGSIGDPGKNFSFVQHVSQHGHNLAGQRDADHALQMQLAWRVGFWRSSWGKRSTQIFLRGNGRALAVPKVQRAGLSPCQAVCFCRGRFGFLVWFIAFLAVGGEWFAMWQSQVWNGQQPAFRILASILLVLIFVAQPDAEL